MVEEEVVLMSHSSGVVQGLSAGLAEGEGEEWRQKVEGESVIQ